MREKAGKSRNTVLFQWFWAPEGRKVGSLKRRVRSQLARWREMKNCTSLWREARFQVKMYKTHHCRTTFGSCDVEKVHAVVARSTFRSQNVQNTPARTTFGSWDVKKVHAVVARSTFRSQNVQNTPLSQTTFGSWDVEKVHAVVAWSTFRSQHVQNTPLSRTTFGRSELVSRGKRKGLCTFVKSEQNVRVSWHFQKRWQAWDIWRGPAKMHFPW